MTLFNVLKEYIARAITRTLPADQWYASAHKAACLLAHLRQPSKYPYKDTLALSRAVKLNTLLALLSRQGRSFSIPVHSEPLDLFRRPRPNGLILCSTHTPLAKLALGHLVKAGFSPTVALAADPGVVDAITIWGTVEKIPAIRTGPTVLLKAKSILQRGGTISVMVDSYLGGPYSPNIFHLAEKLNADIVFMDAMLQRDGTIDVRFGESVWNGRMGAHRVQGQLHELYQRTSTLLRHYDQAGYRETPVPTHRTKLTGSEAVAA